MTAHAEDLLTRQIRVSIIDDNRLMREGLSALLNAQPDLCVAATGADLPDALRVVLEAAPDVVLVDARWVSGDHGRAVQQIRNALPTARVIVMNLLPDPHEVVALAHAGVNGFVTRDAATDDLVATVRSVADGTDMIPPALAGSLLMHLAHDDGASGSASVDGARLTTREREVMELIADGMGNKAIARRLGVADDTVKSHVRNMLEKLALHSRLEIAAHSRRAQLPPSRP